MQVDDPPRKRCRPKRIWMEAVRGDLNKCSLAEDLARDRLEWRKKLHVANPNIGQGFDDYDDDGKC